MKRSLIPLVILLISASVITACSSAATAPPTSAPAAITIAPSVAATTAVVSTASVVATPSVALKPVTSSPVATATTPSSSKKYGGVFRDVTASGPGAPIGAPWAANGSSFAYMQSAIQTLLKEQGDASITACLAASYDVVSDPASPSVTFHLQKGG